MPYKEILFEPPYKSFFLINHEGKIIFAGSDEMAYRILIEDGFLPEDAREAVLYARSTLGSWVSLDKFRRGGETYVKAGMYIRGITEAEIRDMVKRGPDFKGEKNKDALRGLLRDVDAVIGAIRSSWNNARRGIEAMIPRLKDEEVPEYVDLINGLVDFLTALNRFLGTLQR